MQTTPPETMPKVTPEVLDWNKQWYPVHAVRDLDPTKPHPVTLLGLPPNHICLLFVAQRL